MISSRLREQGFINHHRKLLFRLVSITLMAYLFYAPVRWELPGVAVICMQIVGSLLMFAGIVGRGMSTISIGGHKDNNVIKTELYSICRNPLYFSSFLLAFGVGLVSGRVDFLIIVVISFLAIFYPMMRNEAKFLRARFSEFAEYEKSVPLFFPDFTLWNERKNFEINFRLVKRTFLDAALALPAIPVMILLSAIS